MAIIISGVKHTNIRSLGPSEVPVLQATCWWAFLKVILVVPILLAARSMIVICWAVSSDMAWMGLGLGASYKILPLWSVILVIALGAIYSPFLANGPYAAPSSIKLTSEPPITVGR